MRRKYIMALVIICLLSMTGCSQLQNELITNRYADVLLTKNNEIQFRFRINNVFLEGQQLYKVRINIHDEKLASAIGKRNIVYGDDQVINGEYLDVTSKGEKFIFMEPIPLKKDLHISEIKSMIEKDHAVSIEVFNDQQVFGRSYLTNFSSEL